MGRPTKLTPEVQQDIVNALQAGNYFDASCGYARIAESTGYKWMARGKAEIERREQGNVKPDTKQWNDEQPYVEFVEAITHATAQVEVTVIAQIRQAGREDWRANTWFMEHRYPDKWGRRVERQEVTGADGVAIKTYVTFKPDEWDTTS